MANNIRVLIQKPVDGSGSGVQTVKGDGVNNADPLNPVLSFPNADEIDDSTTTNKFATGTELTQIGTNTTNIDSKVSPTDYAVFDTGGTLKARLDGTDLYLTNDGTDA